MKVIAGRFRGRILRTPPGRQLRPTQGHVRQVLFDIVGDGVVGTRVLDLFAGVGAVGIEALSRGAEEVCFVERDPVALRCLRENLTALEPAGRARVLPVPVEVACRILEAEEGSFRWVFSDPPYRLAFASWALRVTRGGRGAILDPEGTLILETSRRQEMTREIGGLACVRTHEVGETSIRFYEWEGREDGPRGDLSGDV